MAKSKAPRNDTAQTRYEAPCRALNAESDSRVILIGDHASNAVPAEFGTLGLPASSFSRHIACDLGIAPLVMALSDRLKAPAILAGFSRLVIDPNRGEDDPTLVMRLSDGEIIPGNARVDETELNRRLDAFHRPYHRAIEQAIERVIESGKHPLLISLHSFTPVWRGRPRPWHCGILWASDRRTADRCLEFLRSDDSLVVGDNEPYSGELEGDCLDRHGTKRGIPHVLIEIRQDLIAAADGIEAWTNRLELLSKNLLERNPP